MNSNRCSRLAVLLFAFALVASTAAPAAAAVSVSSADAPSEAEVGEDVTATFTLEQPFSQYEGWTLNGTTELNDVTWTVKLYDQAGDKVGQQSYDGQAFNHSLNLSSNAVEVEVVVTGTAPEVENFSYDPPQQALLAELTQVREGGSSDTIDAWRFRPYTPDSDEAREAIAAAEAAISDAEQEGGDVSDAEDTLDSAVSSFDHGVFDTAIDLAEDAEESADSAAQSSQRTRLLLYGGLGLLATVAVVGGVFWYRSQQDDYDKLR